MNPVKSDSWDNALLLTIDDDGGEDKSDDDDRLVSLEDLRISTTIIDVKYATISTMTMVCFSNLHFTDLRFNSLSSNRSSHGKNHVLSFAANFHGINCGDACWCQLCRWTVDWEFRILQDIEWIDLDEKEGKQGMKKATRELSARIWWVGNM